MRKGGLFVVVVVCAASALAYGCSENEDTNATSSRPDAAPLDGPAGGEDAPTSGDSGGEAAAKKRAFATTTVWEGDLVRAAKVELDASVDGGREAADALCNAGAKRAGLGGTWVAWLSSSSPGRSDALQWMPDAGGPWYLVDGTTRVFANAAALVQAPEHAIDKNERGESLVELDGGATPAALDAGFGTLEVWTGTDGDGTANGNGMCGGIWASNSFANEGLVGSMAKASDWTSSALRGCGQAHRLYCFER